MRRRIRRQASFVRIEIVIAIGVDENRPPRDARLAAVELAVAVDIVVDGAGNRGGVGAAARRVETEGEVLRIARRGDGADASLECGGRAVRHGEPCDRECAGAVVGQIAPRNVHRRRAEHRVAGSRAQIADAQNERLIEVGRGNECVVLKVGLGGKLRFLRNVGIL